MTPLGQIRPPLVGSGFMTLATQVEVLKMLVLTRTTVSKETAISTSFGFRWSVKDDGNEQRPT